MEGGAGERETGGNEGQQNGVAGQRGQRGAEPSKTRYWFDAAIIMKACVLPETAYQQQLHETGERTSL